MTPAASGRVARNPPLLRALFEDADPSRAVAVGAGGSRGHEHFLRDVSALILSPRLERGPRWLLQSEDAYRLAVVFAAAAARGARVALPPNFQPGTLRELRAGSDLVFAEAGSTNEAFVDPLAVCEAGPSRRILELDVLAAAPLIDLFTSGSSGPGKLVTKALSHLESEVVELERGFGGAIDTDAVVLATVPAHHLYGLLFRVLWPLYSGRPFARDSVLMPDELLARVAAAERAVIVSSPAHLRHLAASPRLAEHAGRIAAVFSSGGPLETATALAIEDAIGFAPMEIFGSTETGGVASRRTSRIDPSPRWSLFAPVAIDFDAEDSRLIVTSPFVTSPGEQARGHTSAADGGIASPQTWTMGDRAERDGDGFRLAGRSDRVAKIGEKTFSLPDLEAALCAHEMVDACLIGSYASARAGSEAGTRRLGALVVLRNEGRRHLAAHGRRALQSLLAAHLAERWDRIALPRRWRFCATLPIDARGKSSQRTIENALVQPAADVLDALLVGETRDGDGQWLLEFVVPRDLAYLAGHYDAFALVPGVVQIHWVMSALSRITGRGVIAQRMEAIKFKNVLQPAQAFTMRLALEPAQPSSPQSSPDAMLARVTFRLGNAERVFSSGRISFTSSGREAG